MSCTCNRSLSSGNILEKFGIILEMERELEVGRALVERATARIALGQWTAAFSDLQKAVAGPAADKDLAQAPRAGCGARGLCVYTPASPRARFRL